MSELLPINIEDNYILFSHYFRIPFECIHAQTNTPRIGDPFGFFFRFFKKDNMKILGYKIVKMITL